MGFLGVAGLLGQAEGCLRVFTNEPGCFGLVKVFRASLWRTEDYGWGCTAQRPRLLSDSRGSSRPSAGFQAAWGTRRRYGGLGVSASEGVFKLPRVRGATSEREEWGYAGGCIGVFGCFRTSKGSSN